MMFLSLSPLCGAAENPPSLGGITDQVTLKNQSVTVEFTVSDQETAAADLSLSGSSADTDLVPNANILFGGSGGNRSATVIPETDQTGTVEITITVEDEDSQTASTTFNLRVNSRPTIAAIANQQTDEDTAKEVGLEIDDAETAVEALTLSWSAGDPGLIADITFNISSSDQSLTISPAADENGETDITVTVDDGDHSASETLILEILPVNDAPVISGSLAGSGSRDPIPDNSVTPVFDQITIDDIDQGRPGDENITVEVTLLPQGQEGANDPQFENRGTQFQLTGTPAEVQQALRGVNFDPAENVRAVGDLSVYDVLINPSGGVPSGGDLGNFQIVIQVQDQDELEAVIGADLQEEMTLEVEFTIHNSLVAADSVTEIKDSDTDVRPF
jgi:hypothetical protein